LGVFGIVAGVLLAVFARPYTVLQNRLLSRLRRPEAFAAEARAFGIVLACFAALALALLVAVIVTRY
jgi:drug/metabolite transporter (DMT)-like permease